MIGKGCVKTYPPNGLGEVACDKLWKEAREIYVGDKMAEAEQIHVEKSDPSVDLDICYRPEIYKSRGWCKLATDKNKWGICSPSCAYFVGLVCLTHYKMLLEALTFHTQHGNFSISSRNQLLALPTNMISICELGICGPSSCKHLP